MKASEGGPQPAMKKRKRESDAEDGASLRPSGPPGGDTKKHAFLKKKTASLDKFRDGAENNRDEFVKAIKKGHADEREQTKAINRLKYKKQDAKTLIAKKEARQTEEKAVAANLATLQGNLASFQEGSFQTWLAKEINQFSHQFRRIL